MDGDLDRYLKSDVLQLYVFDYKEEQMDIYVGKARVPLLPLAQDEEINSERHSSGQPNTLQFFSEVFKLFIRSVMTVQIL